jgi:ubiquinone/menaquinone biosynthesis C-methylase UbiE
MPGADGPTPNARAGSGRWLDDEHFRHLHHPDRERWLPKEPVLAMLALAPGMTVADVGAGSGYLTGPLAAAVGQTGVVFAVDPSPAAHRHLAERFGGDEWPQVVRQVGTAEATGLADAAVDRILWHAVFHELADRGRAWAEARRILKPGGRLVVVDWKPELTPMGPPVAERVAAATAAAEAEAAGYRVVERTEPGPATWGLVLERP